MVRNLIELLKLTKKAIYTELKKSTDYTDNDNITLLMRMIHCIKLLTDVRHSEVLTGEIMSKMSKYYNVKDMALITYFLLYLLNSIGPKHLDSKYLYSFIYAHNALARVNNKIRGEEYWKIKDIDERQLFEILKINAIRNNDKRYIISSDVACKQIYDICYEAFDCDYLTFRECLETANFNGLKIKKQNVVQDLTYRLSGFMNEEWYTAVCKKMGWKKVVVSGQKAKLEHHKITMRLDKVLPRPPKR